jgi:hypothetical protein
VDGLAPSKVTEVGVIVQLEPSGAPEQLKETVCVEPSKGVTVMV